MCIELQLTVHSGLPGQPVKIRLAAKVGRRNPYKSVFLTEGCNIIFSQYLF